MPTANMATYSKELNAYLSTYQTLIKKNSAWDEIDKSLEKLQSSLKKLTDKSTFNSHTVSNSNQDAVSFTLGEPAVQNIYNIKINQLASTAKVSSTNPVNPGDVQLFTLNSVEEINTGLSGVDQASMKTDVAIASGSAALGIDERNTIVSGSFTINNEAINITSEDTITSILDKINNSQAGVLAQYDHNSDTISIKGYSIDLKDDTTGFLDAMKISYAAPAESGEYVSGFHAPIYSTDLSNQILSGAFSINNVEFNVDINRDSIASLIDKVNNSNAGVRLTYNSDDDTLVMESKTIGDSMVLQDGESGFLRAFGFMDTDSDGGPNENISVYSGQSADFEINGEQYQNPVNSFVIDGNTINLLSEGESEISVEQSSDKAKSAIEGFVSLFNESVGIINKNLKGTLKNDDSLVKLSKKLYNSVASNINNTGDVRNLKEMGIGWEKVAGKYTGKLSFNQSYFDSKFESIKENAQKFFAEDTDGDSVADDAGYSVLMNNYLNNYTNNDSGSIASKINKNDLNKYKTQISIQNTTDKMKLIGNEYLNQQNSAWNSVLFAMNNLESKLAELRNDNVIMANKAQSSNLSVASAKSGSGAVQAVYSVWANNTATAAEVNSSDKIGLASGSQSIITSIDEISLNSGPNTDPKARADIAFKYGQAGSRIDIGKRVTSGYFQINGVNVDISGNDTINSVLARINISDSGVSGFYDDDTDKIYLASQPESEIVFGDDTTGFLDAMKLRALSGNQVTTQTVYGNPWFKYKTIDQTPLAEGDDNIQNGSFSVNGVNFEVDTQNDSLYSLLYKINKSDAGVYAKYNGINDTVSIRSKELGREIRLENDSSNFLKKLKLLDLSGDNSEGEGVSVYNGEKTKATINGENFVSDTNLINYQGTTFDIKSKGSVDITVTSDNSKIINAIKDFASAYNYTVSAIDKELSGSLKNNKDLISLKNNLREKTNGYIENSGSFNNLKDIGLVKEKDKKTGKDTGKLVVNDKVLKSAAEIKLDSLRKLFSDDIYDNETKYDIGLAVDTGNAVDNYISNKNGIIISNMISNNEKSLVAQKEIQSSYKSILRAKDSLEHQYQALSKAPNLNIKQRKLMDNLLFQMKALAEYNLK